MTTKIFIGNLSSETQGEDLRPLFQKFGKVTECDVLRNYGFVHMEDSSEAKSAISDLDGYSLHGNRMRVELSTGKSGGGGGGGRGGGRGRGGRGGARFGGRSSGDPYYRPYPSYDEYRRPYPPRPSERYPPTSRSPFDDRYGRIPPPPERDDRYRYSYPEERRLPPRYDDRVAAYDRSRADAYYRDRSPMGRPPPDYYRRLQGAPSYPVA